MGLARQLLNTALGPVGLELVGRGSDARAASLLAERDVLAAQLQAAQAVAPAAPQPRNLADEVAIIEGLEGEEKSAKILSLLFFAHRNLHLVDPLFASGPWRTLAEKPLYHGLLGVAEFSRGNFTVAEAYMERAMSASADPAYVHVAARCATARGDEARCAEVLRQGLARTPHEKLLAVELAASTFRLGDAVEAQRILDPAVSVFDPLRQQADELAAELRKAEEAGTMERVFGGDLYDDAFVEQLWWSYHEAFSTATPWQDGTCFIGHLVREHVADLQRKVNAPAIVDFGVMTAFPNLQLARMFPDTKHYGVDRQTLIKTLNERFYSAPNLSFVDGDIFEVLRGLPRGGILVHARTATVCYPAFVRELYRKCAEYGVGHIVAIEFGGVSKHTLRFHDFAGDRSVASRSNMFFHPYRRMLAEAGYEPVRETHHTKQYGIGVEYGNGESTICLTASRRS